MIKRPIRKSKKYKWPKGDFTDYTEDLEKYCDELEIKFHNAELNISSNLDSALNEACDKLEMYHRTLYNLVTELNDCSATPRTEPYPMWKTKEEWKECLLNANK